MVLADSHWQTARPELAENQKPRLDTGVRIIRKNGLTEYWAVC